MILDRKNPKIVRVGNRVIILNGVDKLSYFDLTTKKIVKYKKFLPKLKRGKR